MLLFFLFIYFFHRATSTSKIHTSKIKFILLIKIALKKWNLLNCIYLLNWSEIYTLKNAVLMMMSHISTGVIKCSIIVQFANLTADIVNRRKYYISFATIESVKKYLCINKKYHVLKTRQYYYVCDLDMDSAVLFQHSNVIKCLLRQKICSVPGAHLTGN